MLDALELAAVLALFGVVLLAISWQRHRHHRDFSAIVHAIIGVMLVSGSALVFELSLNYNTYQPLPTATPQANAQANVRNESLNNSTINSPLAELDIQQQRQGFAVTLLQIPSGAMQVFSLKGNYWRLQARVLEVRHWAAVLGFQSRLRLEYLFSEDAQHGVLDKFRISNDAGIHLADWASAHASPSAALHTHLIESDAQPLSAGQRFHVYLQGDQLELRQITRKVEVPPTAPVTPTLNSHAEKLLKDSNLAVP